MIPLSQLSDIQIDQGIRQIEARYKQSTGNIDLMALSKDQNLFATWRELTNVKRARAKAKKAGEKSTK